MNTPFAITEQCQVQAAAIRFGASQQTYAVGQTRLIAGFMGDCIDKNSAFSGWYAEQHPAEITFRIVWNGARINNVLTSQQGGYSYVTPETAGTFNASLVAEDSSGAELVVAWWMMTVSEFSTFLLRNDTDCNWQDLVEAELQAQPFRRPDSDRFDNGTIVVLPGFTRSSCQTITSLFQGYETTQGGAPDVSFAVQVTDLSTGLVATLGEDTFVNSDSGKVSITLAEFGNFSVELAARSGMATLELVRWQLEVRVPDTFLRSCGEHGRAVEDEGAGGVPIKQNGIYHCLCNPDGNSPGYVRSANQTACEQSRSDASSAAAGGASGEESADTSTVVVSTVLGAVVLAIGALLMLSQLRLRWIKRRPIDVGAMQDEVLRSMGLGIIKNIKPDEFGFTLSLGSADGSDTAALSELFTAAQSSVSKQGQESEQQANNWQQFQGYVATAVAGASPRLTKALTRARITVSNPATLELLVIMSKSGHSSSIGEATVATLHKAATKHKLRVGEHPVVDVGVACPRVIPREIERKCLTRLHMLGEGAFGVVQLCVVDERHTGAPPFNVAAKTVKADSGGNRDDLLREAALMALFDHRNVVALVGICTVPRDVPSLMLMGLCEGGTLGDCVRNAEPGSLSTFDLLTFLAQTLQGLVYIATRRVVHRDVAARNVLLDSTGRCKVSDFGKACSLEGTDKEYIRATDQLAIRWCAAEVIREGKYSTASDVWSFGVLAFEVFTGAALPYSHMYDSLTEISAHVKEGGILEMAPGMEESCPVKLYEQLMVPCWDSDTKARPTFGDLYSVAVFNGAQEDDEALAERAVRRAAARRDGAGSTETAADDSDRTLLGPTVHHLESTLLPATLRALQPRWIVQLSRVEAEQAVTDAGIEGGFLITPGQPDGFAITTFQQGRPITLAVLATPSNGSGRRPAFVLAECGVEFKHLYGLVAELMRTGDDGASAKAGLVAPLVTLADYGCDAPTAAWASLEDDPASANIWNMVHGYAKPASATTVCPRDGQVGCAYVDTLSNPDDVRRATALLSYSWGYKVKAVSETLSGWCGVNARDPKTTAIWICSLCLNQFRMSATASPEALAAAFGDRVVAIGRILPMLEPWSDPGYVKRAWCLFEMYTAIQFRNEVEVDIVLSPDAKAAFLATINAAGTDAEAIDGALAHVKSEEATASVAADLEAIRALVLALPGGFQTLNATVKQHMRQWFVGLGGVKVAHTCGGQHRSAVSSRLMSSAHPHHRLKNQPTAQPDVTPGKESEHSEHGSWGQTAPTAKRMIAYDEVQERTLSCPNRMAPPISLVIGVDPADDGASAPESKFTKF